eukprot:TRINITY_DN70533_c0_g1_i1.p1 TRINITY_DN70533_c0_g1~~TRINITY_DN70533_c0_g1_i1.p1  ORF type:complete len:121 (+),score=13.79 TRINITY_DN70533_c0_g1_i1:81-443(+)
MCGGSVSAGMDLSARSHEAEQELPPELLDDPSEEDRFDQNQLRMNGEPYVARGYAMEHWGPDVEKLIKASGARGSEDETPHKLTCRINRYSPIPFILPMSSVGLHTLCGALYVLGSLFPG